MKNLKIKSFTYILAIFVFVFFSNSLMGQKGDPKPLDPFILGQTIQQKLKDTKTGYIASELTDVELWSTIISTDSLLEIVYQPVDFVGNLIEDDVIFDIKSKEFIDAKNKVIDLVEKNNSSKTVDNILIYEDDEAPIIILKVNSYESVYAVKNSRNVQQIAMEGLMNESYVNDFRKGINTLPARNEAFVRGLFGFPPGLLDLLDLFGILCKDKKAKHPYINLDYDHFNPDFDEEEVKRVPWHFTEMNILKANRCAAGAGVKVAVLDTGISKDQERLNAEFNSTFPSRKVSAITSLSLASVWDNCGHGTHMAGAIAAPKYDNAVRGAAYESDLLSIKAVRDVFLFSSSAINNLNDAMKIIRSEELGSAGTKIMSMSVAYLWPSLKINWSLNRLDKKKGILMFAAKGTIPNKPWLQWARGIPIWPAYNNRTVAVTGVFTNFPSYSKFCDRCSYGKGLDFVVPMQIGYKPDEDGGGEIITHSLRSNGAIPTKAGGSSIATSTMAGAAAIVWGLPENQNKSDEEILEILRSASTYPNGDNDDFGYGVVDVAKAIGCTAVDPEIVIQLEDEMGTLRTNFTICEDIYLNTNGSNYIYEGHMLSLKSVVNGEPTAILVETSLEFPYAGTLPLLNLTEIIETEEENFSFTPGETYQITLRIKDVALGWHSERMQFTIQQLPLSSNVLPVSSSHTYNFGLENQSLISNIDINNGGTLRVNNLGSTGYLPGSGPDTEIKTYYAEVKEYCGSFYTVTVNDGGQFILGNDASGAGDQKAIVTVREGNTVHIKAGGRLRLARGSQLIIEDGAKLIIDDGAIIELWWPESMISIGGELEINGDFEFGGKGFFQFNPTNTLTLNADFNLVGKGIDKRFIRLSEGTTVEVDNGGVNLSQGLIEIAPNSSINVLSNGQITTEFINFKSTTEGYEAGNGLQLIGAQSADLNLTIFESLYLGLTVIDPPSPDQLRIEECRFYNNTFGIIITNGNEVVIGNAIFQAREKGNIGIDATNLNILNINSSTLEGYTTDDATIVVGISALNLKNIGVVNSNSNRLRDNIISVTLKNVNEYNMNGGFIDETIGSIDSRSIGIYVPSLGNNQINISNIALRSGAKIAEQGIGIKVDDGGIINDVNPNIVYGKVLMDCGKLVNNNTGVKGNDITLEINAFEFCGCTTLEDAIPNTFIKSSGWPSNPILFFDICYDNVIPTNDLILAEGNYWSQDPESGDDYKLTNCNTSNTSYSLITEMQMTEEPNACVPGGIKDDDPKDPKQNPRSDKGASLDEIGIDVYPNPFTNHIYLETSVAEAGTISIQIMDALGKVIQLEERTLVEGENILSITTNNNLVAGVYYLRTQMNGQKAKLHKVIYLEER